MWPTAGCRVTLGVRPWERVSEGRHRRSSWRGRASREWRLGAPGAVLLFCFMRPMMEAGGGGGGGRRGYSLLHLRRRPVRRPAAALVLQWTGRVARRPPQTAGAVRRRRCRARPAASGRSSLTQTRRGLPELSMSVLHHGHHRTRRKRFSDDFAKLRVSPARGPSRTRRWRRCWRPRLGYQSSKRSHLSAPGVCVAASCNQHGVTLGAHAGELCAAQRSLPAGRMAAPHDPVREWRRAEGGRAPP
jgi:hypothetical protein